MEETPKGSRAKGELDFSSGQRKLTSCKQLTSYAGQGKNLLHSGAMESIFNVEQG